MSGVLAVISLGDIAQFYLGKQDHWMIYHNFCESTVILSCCLQEGVMKKYKVPWGDAAER